MSSDHGNVKENYWFPKKKVGIGWGLPTAWQGWVVLALVSSAAIGGYFVFDLPEQEIEYAATILISTAILLIACYLKGEPLK